MDSTIAPVIDIVTSGAIVTTTAVLVVLLALLILMIKKEIASGIEGHTAKQLSRVIDVALIPLLIAFSTAAVLHIIDILN
ncbi:MAG: hypothetical protein MI924_29620 [Chloroflexales bacterium]|nr:hypothetical protein [Chloroflexales bacterium]